MSTFTRLDALYKTCPRITLDPPVVFIADTHLGDGSRADNFWPYRFRFEEAIVKYRGWKVVTLGDMFDRWQFGIEAIGNAGYDSELIHFFTTAAVKLPGNHDWEMGLGRGSNGTRGPEAALLTISGQEIFVCHGHQGDWINDAGRGVGRFLVRYFWTPLERLGLKEPELPGNRHAAQRVNLIDWSNEKKITSIYGHIHSSCEVGYAHICESPTTGKMRFLEFTDGLRFADL